MSPPTYKKYNPFKCNEPFREDLMVTVEVYEPLRKLASSRVSGCGIAHTSTSITEKRHSVALYNEKVQPFIETNVLGLGLRASLLQVRDGMQFPKNEAPNNAALQPIAFQSKSLTSTETRYGNIEREALSKLHDVEKFHLYCFTHKSP